MKVKLITLVTALALIGPVMAGTCGGSKTLKCEHWGKKTHCLHHWIHVAEHGSSTHHFAAYDVQCKWDGSCHNGSVKNKCTPQEPSAPAAVDAAPEVDKHQVGNSYDYIEEMENSSPQLEDFSNN